MRRVQLNRCRLVMRSRLPRAGATVLALGMLASAPAGTAVATGGTTADRQAYISAPEAAADCSQQLGATCFRVPPDQRRVQILVSDDSGRRPIAATYEFRSSAGAIDRHAFCDGVAPTVPAGALELRVYVAPFDPLDCAAGPSTASTGAVEITWVDSSANLPDVDAEPQPCLGVPPQALDTDPMQRLRVRALVLLDGVSRSRADELAAAATRVYDQAGITLDVHYRTVTLPAGDQQQLLGYAKAAIGGRRPSGYDVVHVLTSKQMERTGVADCIGGIAYPSRAFSISEDLTDPPTWCYVKTLGVCYGNLSDFAGKVMAHEIGHLLGGQHQLSSYECTATVDATNAACVTVMDGQPLVPYGNQFSTANRTLMRGDVRQFAAL